MSDVSSGSCARRCESSQGGFQAKPQPFSDMEQEITDRAPDLAGDHP